jgi:hypothetical protein
MNIPDREAIRALWADFAATAHAEGVSEGRRSLDRAVFYAGALSLLMFVRDSLAVPDPVPSWLLEGCIERCQEELQGAIDELDEPAAPGGPIS